MKIYLPQLDKPVLISEEKVNTIIIENPDVFRSVLKDIFNQIDGYSGDSVLSVSDVPVQMNKYLEILTDFISFDINIKKIISKIVQFLDKASSDEIHYAKTEELINNIKTYLEELTNELPVEIDFSGLTASGILKAANISIQNDYESVLEMLLDYFELVREFEADKLFITVNLRSFYSNGSIEAFIKSVVDHKYRVLMLENCEHSLLASEKRVIIDNDLCLI